MSTNFARNAVSSCLCSRASHLREPHVHEYKFRATSSQSDNETGRTVQRRGACMLHFTFQQQLRHASTYHLMSIHSSITIPKLGALEDFCCQFDTLGTIYFKPTTCDAQWGVKCTQMPSATCTRFYIWKHCHACSLNARQAFHTGIETFAGKKETWW